MAGRRKVSKVEFPQELKRFNWGAFFGTWIWGLVNKSYITLLQLILGLTKQNLTHFFNRGEFD